MSPDRVMVAKSHFNTNDHESKICVLIKYLIHHTNAS